MKHTGSFGSPALWRHLVKIDRMSPDVDLSLGCNYFQEQLTLQENRSRTTPSVLVWL